MALLCAIGPRVFADPALDAVLRPAPPFRFESVRFRFTHFEQDGHGYQSPAGPPEGPGSEKVEVEEPIIEVVAKQGDRLTHRLLLPVDIITAASPDAVDAVSTASGLNKAGSIDLTSIYKWTPTTDVGARGGVHIEETYRSWNAGFLVARSMADDNATLSASVNQFFDWFDRFDMFGFKHGRTSRSSTHINIGLAQVLSESALAGVQYGVTVQLGDLGTSWQSVPSTMGSRISERVPSRRQRHALSARIAQALPWQGALKGSYRFYVDDWEIIGNTLEVELYQRLSPWMYLRAGYRLHHQTNASFFAIQAQESDPFRTADSDLANFFAHTFGAKLAIDVHRPRQPQRIQFDLSYDRYVRSNHLWADIYSLGFGLLF